MKQFVLLIGFLYLYINVYSQHSYPADSIDPVLLTQTNAVVRDYHTSFTIINPGKATLHVFYAVTVLNSAGAEHGELSEFYHKFKKISGVNGYIYDKNGFLLKELKRSDIQDVSPISDFTLYEDNRLKYCKPVADFYPYTVVYEYDIDFDGLFYYPTWMSVPGFHVSAENVSLIVNAPADLGFRFKSQNIQTEPEINHYASELTYKWELSRVQAIEDEPLSQDFSVKVPAVFMAPKKFEIKGYQGSLDSWKAFGKWVSILNQGRDELSNPEAIQNIQEIMKNTTDQQELIRSVYEYMQSRTRYVNVKLGIGGYQPFKADLVHEVGYGDCKALTIYTKALLSIAGIPSYYTLVRAGSSEPDIMVDFPSPQFNHVILCVPLQNDTVWLECTNQHIPFGYIGDFTHDRHVLMITDEGGKIVKTPKYSANMNVQTQFASIRIDEEGVADIELNTSMAGLQYDALHDVLHESAHNQRKWIYENIKLPSMQLLDFHFQEKPKAIPVAGYKIKIRTNALISASNKRLFIPSNPFNKIKFVPKPDDDRKSTIIINFPYTDIDTLHFQLPSNTYQIEYCPDDIEISNSFGYYKSFISFNLDKRQVSCMRHLVINDGAFSPEMYAQLVAFLNTVKEHDNAKMVLIRE